MKKLEINVIITKKLNCATGVARMEVKMKSQILPNDYKETLMLIKHKIELAQQQAIISVNTNLLNLYWEIRKYHIRKKRYTRLGCKSY